MWSAWTSLLLCFFLGHLKSETFTHHLPNQAGKQKRRQTLSGVVNTDFHSQFSLWAVALALRLMFSGEADERVALALIVGCTSNPNMLQSIPAIVKRAALTLPVPGQLMGRAGYNSWGYWTAGTCCGTDAYHRADRTCHSPTLGQRRGIMADLTYQDRALGGFGFVSVP